MKLSNNLRDQVEVLKEKNGESFQRYVYRSIDLGSMIKVLVTLLTQILPHQQEAYHVAKGAAALAETQATIEQAKKIQAEIQSRFRHPHGI